GTLLAVMAAGGVGLTQDDGYYYFKIAQNLAAGRGSTFDGLHGTNGYHPLWLLVVGALFALQPDPRRALVAGNALRAALGRAARGGGNRGAAAGGPGGGGRRVPAAPPHAGACGRAGGRAPLAGLHLH